jgi:hypothetical protein
MSQSIKENEFASDKNFVVCFYLFIFYFFFFFFLFFLAFHAALHRTLPSFRMGA